MEQQTLMGARGGTHVAERSVEVTWTGEGLRFTGKSGLGEIAMASGGEETGLGPSPTEVLLMALGGCTGIDIVTILVKMRQPLQGLRIEVVGHKEEEHPQRFIRYEVVYHLRGALDEKRVRRAVELSEQKYCSVGATLSASAPITSRFVIEND